MKYTPIAIAAVVLIAIIGLFTSMYIVTEKDQVFITRFGKIQGDPTTEPGLYFKVPFIDKVRRFERRILEWDGHPSEVTTKDKRFIVIDSYARWKISDPKIFFEKVKDEIFAQSRLDDILDGTTRTAVSKHDLVEVVRSDKSRKASVDDDQTEGQSELQPFSIGREAISNDILEDSREKIKEYGIELMDFQFKRINYASTVQAKIFERMIAERKQIAEKFRSEGLGRAAEIGHD
jgi:membrane protease subunit HflC